MCWRGNSRAPNGELVSKGSLRKPSPKDTLLLGLPSEPRRRFMTVDYLTLVRITQELEAALQALRLPHVKRIERLIK